MKLKKLLFGIIGTAALIASSVLCGCDFTATKQEEAERFGNGGAIVSAGESAGIELTSVKLLADEYETNGVSAESDTAYTLTATIKPETTSNKAVSWSVAFVNAESAWASGKSVTDYVTVTPTSSGALTATVACLAPFGEQIKITVTSRDNAEAKADCTVDYASRVTDIGITISGTDTISGSVLSKTIDDSTMTDFSGGQKSDVSYQMSWEENIEIETITPAVRYSDLYTVFDTYLYEYQIEYSDLWIEASGGLSILSGNLPFGAGSYFGRCSGFMTDNTFLQGLLAEEAYYVNSGISMITGTAGVYREIFTLKVTATGTYSSFTKEYRVGINPATTVNKAETASLSLTSMIF